MAKTEAQKRSQEKYMRKSKSVVIRCREDEYNRIKAHADRGRLTVAAYARQAIALRMRDDDAIKGRIDVVPCQDD